MENPGARARKATWNQPLRGGLWIFRGPNFERYGPEAYCIFVLDLPGLMPHCGLSTGDGPERGLEGFLRYLPWACHGCLD